MARSHNNNIPRYYKSDFEASTIAKPPRIKSKELKMNVYQTNQLITDIENFEGTMLINAKFEKELDIQITTPLNFDISKPKFASVSDTGIWGNQLNGFIYEDLDLDTSKYNFITFELLVQDSMDKNKKWRIVSINKIYDLKNKFLYAEVALVLDTIKTIKSLDRAVWRLVSSFTNDTKVKKVKIELDEKTLLFPDGLLISGKETNAGRLRNVTYAISNINEQLVLKLIKARQVNPLLIDDITFSDIKDRHVNIKLGDAGGSAVPAEIPAYLGSSVEVRHETGSTTSRTWISYTGSILANAIGIDYPVFRISALKNPSKIDETTMANSAPKQFQYFSKGLMHEESNLGGNRGIGRSIQEAYMTYQKTMEFLTGIYTIDSHTPSPADQRLFLETNNRTIDQLVIDADTDRKYFVLAKRSDLRNYFSLYDSYHTGIIQHKKPFPKTRMVGKGEWGSNYKFPNIPIVFEIELGLEIFGPRIEIGSLMGEHVKITLYDKNNAIVGIPEMNFNLESVYDDSKTKTTIQL